VSHLTAGFQRARRPEQREARRQAILDAAAAMLAESSVNDISLRQLACRVGLAKSNVLRYFDSREAVFLELLDSAWRDWLHAVAAELDRLPEPAHARYARCRQVGEAIADSLAARTLLCELISVTAGVLERNISIEVARRFKLGFAQNTATLAALVRSHVDGLDEPASEHFAGAVFVIVAGLWPFQNPSEAVAAAVEELGVEAVHPAFDEALRAGLAAHLIGLVAGNSVEAADPAA
jgi:AcrR family transcriptional regulator